MTDNLEAQLLVRMDKKLRMQLEVYAKHNNTDISKVARKALKQFIKENIS